LDSLWRCTRSVCIIIVSRFIVEDSFVKDVCWSSTGVYISGGLNGGRGWGQLPPIGSDFVFQKAAFSRVKGICMARWRSG